MVILYLYEILDNEISTLHINVLHNYKINLSISRKNNLLSVVN